MMPVKADPVSYDVLALAIVFLDSTYTRVLLSCIAKTGFQFLQNPVGYIASYLLKA